MRGQISFEYLVIVGLALLVIVPALLFFLTFTRGGDDSVTHARVAEIGSEMTAVSSEVFALGRSSWLTLDTSIPETVENVSIIHHGDSTPDEMVITYRTKNGLSQGVFFSTIPLSNSSTLLKENSQGVVFKDRVGVVSMRFTSEGDFVQVEVR